MNVDLGCYLDGLILEMVWILMLLGGKNLDGIWTKERLDMDGKMPPKQGL